VNGARGPRKTVFEVQREQRWRIWLLFALLLCMALVTLWITAFVVAAGISIVHTGESVWRLLFSLRGFSAVALLATVASVVYWYAAQAGAKARLMGALHCRPLDRTDRYHQRLANVVEEMRLATGAPRVECVTVGTLGMNAFAFSDLHGGGVVGVTEGALARLSRQQLQAVVAHEFAHILSGSYVTVTVSCMLFGIYSTLADALDGLVLDSADQAGGGTSPSAAGGAMMAGASLARAWLWLLELASQIANAALSRERERQADLAAARFTGDPLSLAEALRMIARHPGGAGFVPTGLAPLCIRAAGSDEHSLLGGWGATHPPIGERISALLLLAHVAPADFERQAETAVERFAAKEHVRRPPATPTVAHAALDGDRIGAAAESRAPVGRLAAAVPSATAAGPAGPAPAVVAPRSSPTPLAGWTPLCPSCGQGLQEADYEGVTLHVCRACGGRLASADAIQRVCARREVAFSDEQRRLAELLLAQADHLRRGAVLDRGRVEIEHIACPRCGVKMLRRHYSYEHAVEVDCCTICGVYWFERDELEVLQLLHERQVDRGRA
jgi:Zn-dependent protease with chaperone function/Zn-finger nucleic acid-binding protein